MHCLAYWRVFSFYHTVLSQSCCGCLHTHWLLISPQGDKESIFLSVHAEKNNVTGSIFKKRVQKAWLMEVIKSVHVCLSASTILWPTYCHASTGTKNCPTSILAHYWVEIKFWVLVQLHFWSVWTEEKLILAQSWDWTSLLIIGVNFFRPRGSATARSIWSSLFLKTNWKK